MKSQGLPPLTDSVQGMRSEIQRVEKSLQDINRVKEEVIVE